jgi:hypothetical protein
MIAKGVSDIKGIHSINTKPGPITESNGFLMLYRLAVEKDNLMKRLAWARRRKAQTERRLSEIVFTMHAVEERVKRESASKPNSESRSTLIRY